MTNNFEGFGNWQRNFGGPGGPAGQGMWEAMEQLRGMFDKRPSSRVGKGDVRAAVLNLLAEKPMHGYQIIREIDERSNGSWKPSAGSVYPTLQLLADEGLVETEEADGRKTYSLTEAGRAEAEEAEDRPAPWQASGNRERPNFGTLPKSGVELAQAASQVMRSGTSEQQEEAATVLDDARRRLYAILAQD